MKRLAFVLLLTACGGAAAPAAAPPAPTSSSSAALKAPGEAQVGDRTRCPVSGDEFIVSNDSPHTEYGGKTYYFCCAHCIDMFRADPQKYIGRSGT